MDTPFTISNLCALAVIHNISSNRDILRAIECQHIWIARITIHPRGALLWSFQVNKWHIAKVFRGHQGSAKTNSNKIERFGQKTEDFFKLYTKLLGRCKMHCWGERERMKLDYLVSFADTRFLAITFTVYRVIWK